MDIRKKAIIVFGILAVLLVVMVVITTNKERKQEIEEYKQLSEKVVNNARTVEKEKPDSSEEKADEYDGMAYYYERLEIIISDLEKKTRFETGEEIL